MLLKFTVTGKAETADDAHDSSGVGVQSLGDGANAQQNVFARMLENRANDFLALGAELLDALWKIDCWRLRLIAGGSLFHAARELPKIVSMSTPHMRN